MLTGLLFLNSHLDCKLVVFRYVTSLVPLPFLHPRTPLTFHSYRISVRPPIPLSGLAHIPNPSQLKKEKLLN